MCACVLVGVNVSGCVSVCVCHANARVCESACLLGGPSHCV